MTHDRISAMHRAYQSAIVAGGLVLFFLMLLCVPHDTRAAGGAALFLGPSAGTLLVGSTFDVSILLDTKGAAVNTVEVEVLFPADKMQIASPSVGRSIIQIWPASPLFSNKDGRMYFVGGIPSPGIVTSQGVVLTLTFRVTAPGTAEVRFGEKTTVLANDGKATNILAQHPSAFYTFQVPAPQGPVINSFTHPDQEKWYHDSNPTFVWSKSQFADGYSYEIDQNPSGSPDAVSEGAHSTASFQNLENGVWYLHLRERAGGVWGGVSHYVVKIDDDMPASFRINVSPGTRTVDRNPVLRFFTTDALSGLSHYELKVVPLSSDGGSDALFFEVSPTYQMSNVAEGRYQVIVRALDQAGNTRDEAVTLTIVGALTRFIDPEGITLLSVFIPWPRAIALIGGIVFVSMLALVILWRRHRHHIRHAFMEDIQRLFRFFKRRPHDTTAPTILLFLLVSALLGAVYSMPYLSLAAPVAPTISVAPTTYYPLDEALYLEGVALPNSTVDILFEKPDSRPVRVSVKSNANGEWFFSDRLELASGDWTVRARVANGSPSDWSNPRIIQSAVSGFIIGTLKIKFVPIVLVLGMLFFVALALLVYAFFKAHAVRRRALEAQLLEKDKRLAATLVEQNFSALRRKMTVELSHRDETGQSDAHSPVEDDHRAELLKELDEVEEKIEQQVKGIT